MKLTQETLYSGVGFIKDIENLDEILNSEPKKEWLSTEKINDKEVLSLPIERVEFLMSRLFKGVCYEVKQWTEGVKLAEITVRVNYIDNGIVMFQDGVASSVIKGNGMAIAPALKSMAIKDACHSIGRIFGKDLNRPNTIEKSNNKIDLETVKSLFKQKESLLSPNDLEAANRIISEKEVNSYKKLYESLKKL
ncbi:MAG: hypothetical protein WAS34_18955 [Thiolinea sp.]